MPRPARGLHPAQVRTFDEHLGVSTTEAPDDVGHPIRALLSGAAKQASESGRGRPMLESPVRQIKIMISSTRADLGQYRTEASRIIDKIAREKAERIQLLQLSMEEETQSGDREYPVGVSKRWVDEADWVVLIVGWNYGTISDEAGADGLSVTEWEYRHSLKLGRKLYVFIAGEPQTANQYRVCEEEKEDLKDWIPKQTEIQAERLKQFRKELGTCHAEMFANLPRFRERLEKTLKNAIDDLPPAIQPGTALAELIVSVLPEIRDCLRKVTLVAECKKIHDHLHDLRQHVMKPLREEVLSLWNQGGLLSQSRERVIWRCMIKKSAAIGGLGALRASIGPDHQGLRNSIDAVLNGPDLWNIEANSRTPRPGREEFTEIVDEFACDVQEAFSEADRSMATEEGNLRERYAELLEKLKRARQQRKLGQSDQQRLDDELERVQVHRSRVKAALTGHHRWQGAHDKLEELDAFRERENFERKLNHYLGAPLAKLLSLVDEELERTEWYVTSSSTSEHAPVVAAVQQGPPPTPSLQDTCNIFQKDLRHLKEALETLRQGAGLVAFDEMRRFFDDAFYYVDKSTLREVERARERAEKLEDWLDGLVAAQKAA